MAKQKYPTDTEAGVRTITQIRNLPSSQLTDEEFTKEFFDRFGAKVMILAYVDDKDQYWTFGRLKRGVKFFTYYRSLMCKLKAVFGNHDVKELD